MNLRACLVSQRLYPGDPRMNNQVRALQEAGFEVDVVCMHGQGQAASSVEDGVNIYRIRSMNRQRASKVRYVLEYVSFFLPCLLLLALFQIRKQYKLVYVTNLPDALVFSALVPKLLGAKILFGIHECTPEMFTDRFGARKDGKAIKIMIRLEQAAVRFAELTITCTEQMRQAVISRGADPNRIAVTLNVPDERLFGNPLLPDPENKQGEPFRIITHGTIIKRYGHEVLIRAMPLVLKAVPNAHLEILGRGKLQPELARLVESLGLQNAVTFAGFVPDDELNRRLRAAHCGIVPLLRTPESDLVHTNKMFEYIALGLPVVISRTTAVEMYFNDDQLQFAVAGSEADLAHAIIDLYEHPEKRLRLAQNALRVYDQQYAPAKQRTIYRELFDSVLQSGTKHLVAQSLRTE